MICPRCKTEYRDGFYICADCSIPLVSELPGDEVANIDEIDEIEFVEMLSTKNFGEISVIKSIFDAVGIPYCFLGEQMMTSPILAGGGYARLLVSSKAIDAAKELLKEVEFEEPDLLVGILLKF